MSTCPQCGIETHGTKFCSRPCSSRYNRLHKISGRHSKPYCLICKVPTVEAPHYEGSSYCKKCDAVRAETNYIKRWGSLPDARRHALYKLSPEAYRNLVAEQQGLCAICTVAPIKHVDHDHATGAVRGLLCAQCNSGIGHLKDNPDIVDRAAVYLRKARAA